MYDYAEIIKSRVTIPDILSRYGIGEGKHNRIPCPLHNGKNPNFSYDDKSYICWKCGASGDVIQFVKEYFNINFRETLSKLNDDFALGLNIGQKPSVLERKALAKAELRHKQKVAEMHDKRLKQRAEYWTAFDRVRALEWIIKNKRPAKPTRHLPEDFNFAIMHIEKAKYELDILERRRC